MLALIMRERGGSFRDAIEFAQRLIGQASVKPAPAPRVTQCDSANNTTDMSRVALRISSRSPRLWRRRTPIPGPKAWPSQVHQVLEAQY